MSPYPGPAPYPSPTPPPISPHYKARTLESWQVQFKGELDYQSRLESLEALRQFAANGYAKQVVPLVVETLAGCLNLEWQDNDVQFEEDNSEFLVQLVVAGTLAVRAGPVEEVVPLLTQYIKTGTKNQRAVCSLRSADQDRQRDAAAIGGLRMMPIATFVTWRFRRPARVIQPPSYTH